MASEHRKAGSLAAEAELSWVPRHRGKIYCSPACGKGCTAREHEVAVRGATKLVRRLGPGWKPRVWENMGWHYQAVSPCLQIKVSPSSDTSFTAYFGEPDSPGGRWVTNAPTPLAAVRAVIAIAKGEAVKIVEAVQKFERAAFNSASTKLAKVGIAVDKPQKFVPPPRNLRGGGRS